MPPRKKKIEEGVVVILDVGCGAENDETSSSDNFFEQAKQCVIGLIQKKIFSYSQELISLVLMNSDETFNDLNSRGDGYENIKVEFPLRAVSWDLAKKVNGLKPTKINSVDWLDAMAVAINYIQEEQESESVTLSNLVLISRFAGAADADQADSIVKQLKKLSSELTVIGFGVDQIRDVSERYSNSQKRSLGRLQDNLALVSSMVSKMNSGGLESSALCSFDDTLSHLSYFKGKSVRPTPWKVDLEIGAKIQFELVGYKLVAEQDRFPWKVQKKSETASAGAATVVAGATANAETEDVEATSAVYRDVKAYMEMDDQGDEREVAAEDIVKSYVYGDKIIPFPAHDSETMSYKSGPKSLKLIGFTKQKNVPKYILQGKGVIVFTCGRDSAPAFAAIHKVLEAQELVGLVRRVYNRDNAPTIGTLYPETLDGKKVLTFIELPFAEDVISLKFPSLQHVTPTNEQKDAVNKLIDVLDLADPNDPDNELFNPEKVYDPDRQYMYHVFTHQILHPDEQRPSEPPKHVKKLRTLPPELVQRAEPVIESIKELFPLVEVEQKHWRKGKKQNGDVNGEAANEDAPNEDDADVQQAGMTSLFKPTVVQVNTVHPVQDFETLLERGENHTEVCNQMKKVITKLAQKIVETDDLMKVVAALKTLRKSCQEKDPALYNKWLLEFKNLIQERNLNSVWEKIEEERLSLISNKEAASSDVSEEDSNSFLQLASTKVEVEVNDEDEMMEDL